VQDPALFAFGEFLRCRFHVSLHIKLVPKSGGAVNGITIFPSLNAPSSNRLSAQLPPLSSSCF
ncbi:MAG: hypothetical protein LBF78_06695, partial [Treponema sp.]|nr:hypothetical protein [Treponema sp.]